MSPVAASADPLIGTLLPLAVLIVAAKIGEEVAVRFGQAAVLGELLVGIALGNLPLVGVHVFAPIAANPYIDLLARLGVLVLLFEVGLASTVREMLSVGVSAFLVAAIGVTVTVGLGWGASALLLPRASGYLHVFLGAAIAATSVGITARVLRDLKRQETPEARVILGAAVLDDVLGLLVLAVATAAVRGSAGGRGFSRASTGLDVAEAGLFLVGSLVLGVWLTPRIFHQASRLRTAGVLLALGLTLCFSLAWLAQRMGLAPIVGAFAAGLILESAHYEDFVRRGELSLDTLIAPISGLLAPLFFMLMGMRTDLRVFAQPGSLLLALALVIVAVVSKLVAGRGVLQAGVDRLAVGLGMVPRGEVTLIFASVGQSLLVDDHPLLTTSTYSALIAVVIATTLITPAALEWRLSRLKA